MNWACDFTEDAKQDLHNLPFSIQKRVARAMKVMEIDPFRGDVKALTGPDWQNAFRRRLGSYRLIFTADYTKQKALIIRILIRSKKTYR